ncbi:MAG: helix-hairpin-helix domain-containing protein [Lachnospiraceae bacterium]|nr:helix-hairpin-helix domain-containing protein [Lachnospiraceae bacterium]
MNYKMIRIMALSLSILALCIGCGKQTEAILLEQSDASQTEPPDDTNTNYESEVKNNRGEDQKTEQTTIMIYICGAVENPGVYTLPGQARVFQAIEAAGGLMEDASETYINQAKILQDGEQITIPTRDEAAQAVSGGADGTASDGRVNINTADQTALMTLNGIGETRAAAIIAYREANGAFGSIEDIKNVEGIKDAVFQKISDNITVD